MLDRHRNEPGCGDDHPLKYDARRSDPQPAGTCSGQGRLLEIDQNQLARHVDGLVRQSVEETLNAMLDAEADGLCGARRYERSPDRVDYRAGSYRRKFQTKAGEVELKVPKLRRATFESQ